MKIKSIYAVVLLGIAAFACSKITPQAPDDATVLAAPVSDLTGNQLNLHIQGDVHFAQVFGQADGLGPIFVQNSCESCHVGDGKGNPFNNLTRFGYYNTDGTWNSAVELGGPQLQHRAITGYAPEQLPKNVAHTEFVAPNVTGLGFLAAVTDADILSMSDPDDLNADGISGRVNEIEAPEWLRPDSRYHRALPNGKFIGRFGRKAAAIDLTMQTVDAYKQDMGITSDFDMKDPVNMAESNVGSDEVDDPEISAQVVEKVVFYLKTLKEPSRREGEAVQTGENIFKSIGCENCHKQTLKTGSSEVKALDRVEFHPYTDMLLHDMGAALDDKYTEGVVETNEWRTMPLWGLGLQHESQGGQMFLLHDGRAKTYKHAIDFHGGEAEASRNAFNVLTSSEKEQVIDFLNSL